MGNMKLYMAPGSCTTAIHILLEDIGEFFEAHIVNLPGGEHLRPQYKAINPKSTIPTLVRRDGSAITETLAIAVWLAQSAPKAKLWPEDPEKQMRALEIIGHVTATTHGQGFARVFSAGAFSNDADSEAKTQQMGRSIVVASFAWLSEVIANEGYALGDYSAVDPVLFYVCFWACKTDIPLPPALARHMALMLTRPVVTRVLREEGYDPAKLTPRIAA